MASQPVRVAIDLETTGLVAERDAIIEIGAVKFAGDRVLDTFESFVAAAAPLPYRIQRLTGITPDHLKGAPSLASLHGRLKAFLGDYPLVGHNIAFDVGFLRRVGLAWRNPLVDTYELASALCPSLSSYTLSSIGEALDVRSDTHHRALADAQLTRGVFLALLQRVDTLNPSAARILAELPAGRDWTPQYFMRASQPREPRGGNNAFAGLLTTSLGDQLAARLAVDPGVLTLRVAQAGAEAGADAPAVETAPVAALSTGEHRAGGDATATAITRCLADAATLVVETGSDASGTGATLAPVLRWVAGEPDARVLVSAGSLERMAEVAYQALPTLRDALGLSARDVSVAAVADHTAYLCLHRWFGMARVARDGSLPRDVARGLARIAVWSHETETGLRAEVSFPHPELAAWERARAGVEFAASAGTCAYRREGYCFVARAQRLVDEARVIVTTHAALAAALNGDQSLFQIPRQVVILDAQTFEDDLRRARSIHLEPDALLDALATLADVEPGGKRAGLLHLAAARIERAPERAWFEVVRAAREAADTFFLALRGLLLESQGRAADEVTSGTEPLEQRTLRLDAQAREQPAWNDVTHAWGEVERTLYATLNLSREVAGKLQGKGGKAQPPDALASELLGLAYTIESLCNDGTRLVRSPQDGGKVAWLRLPHAQAADGPPPHAQKPGTRGQAAQQETVDEAPPEATLVPALHGADIHIGGLLKPLTAEGRALVMAGSALAVAGELDHTLGALGLSPAAVRGIVSSSDRAAQTLLCLPGDVPEPNAPHYQQTLNEHLIRLAGALHGRMVVIFPSHAALRASWMGVRRALERQDILVLAQGQEGSARQLWNTFHTEQRVVLLGAGSFWDGTQPTGAPPACVVVPRLPFPALSDPVLEARSEQWSDPQAQFVVPQAALRLRRALDGLAWSHTERNAVVLFDRRVQTRGYGQTILATLPRCEQYSESAARIAERIVEWIG